MKKILLTGASGLLSSKFIKLYGNDYEIHKIYRNKENLEINEYNIDLINLNEIINLLDKIDKIDIVIHLSAQALVWKSIQNPIEDINSNIISTVNLLESFKAYGLEKFIFTSSEAVFGELSSPIESSIKNPITPYGITKYTCENYLSFYRKKYNLNYHIIRPSFIIDFDMSRNPLFDILNTFKTGKVNLFQSVNSEFNFVTSDIVSLNINNVIRDKVLIKELNVVNSINTRIMDVINHLQNNFNRFTVIDKPNIAKQTLDSEYADVKSSNKVDVIDFCNQYIKFHNLG
tara:strand:- start:3186 stop:4049 length:864 start_codon:yes stop_codon:yes gene_type:complete